MKIRDARGKLKEGLLFRRAGNDTACVLQSPFQPAPHERQALHMSIRVIAKPSRPLGIVIAFATWVALLNGCGGSLPEPTLVQHPNESFEEVPYPPPAALAETVPARPNVSGLVWLEGDWVFRGTTYAWVRGGWVVAPKNARYAISKVQYARDGRILFAPASWYDEQGQKLERVRPLAPATTPSNEYTAETQTAR